MIVRISAVESVSLVNFRARTDPDFARLPAAPLPRFFTVYLHLVPSAALLRLWLDKIDGIPNTRHVRHGLNLFVIYGTLEKLAKRSQLACLPARLTVNGGCTRLSYAIARNNGLLSVVFN